MKGKCSQDNVDYTLGNAFLLDRTEVSCRYFDSLWLGQKPLTVLFRTESNRYFYDTGTNKILGCSSIEFDLLNNILKMDIRKAISKTAALYPYKEVVEALAGLVAVVQEKGILRTVEPISFGGAHHHNIKELITKSVGMVQLEVTERCNSRCVYCLYSPHHAEKRNHGTRDMDSSTARAALEHFGRSCSQQEEVAITFYGGEPLLCFPLIMECIHYGRSLLSDKKLSFSITTNATLITAQMAKALADERIALHVSIDGPEDIHDQYRKDVEGKGTFQRTITGLKLLYDAYGEQKDKITLSMVYSPPYSAARLDRMAGLWDQYSWLPRKIGLTVSYAVDFFPSTLDCLHTGNADFSLVSWAGKLFLDDYRNNRQHHPMVANIIEKEMARIIKRPIYNSPIREFCLNGCCLPGVRKQYVTVDGTLVMCERVGSAPAIGDVFRGVHIEQLVDLYVNEYSRLSLSGCSHCWALQLCPICYLHSFSKGRMDIQKKTKSCDLARASIANMLALFCRLIEINPSGLDYLGSWVIR
ncbi:MAG: radical SAM protein [Acidobacteria bacterium]|nr:radical SAM protein [Acidobacteriota bacterium]